MQQTKELTKKGKFFDYSLLIIILFLVAFGLVMVYSTSSYSAAQKFGDASYYFKKQLVATAIGLGCMLLATVINYRVWYKLAPVIVIISFIMVFMVLTPLGLTFNGARRWLNFKVATIQPAEALKLGIIIGQAAFIFWSGRNINKIQHAAVSLGMGATGALMLFVITKNLSSAIIIAGITYVMFIVAHPRPIKTYIITAIGAVAAVVGLLIFFKVADSNTSLGFRFQRVLAWRNPEAYASGTGYQTLQSLYAIGSGGFWGKGLGASIQKLGFIPEAQNDMIFSVVCEELGIFGGLSLMVLYLLMMYRFVMIATNIKDRFGTMLVTGVMAHIAIQVVLNIAVVTNTIPNTGISLPFISYGGTSVMFLLIEMGIVLNISWQIQVPVETREERDELAKVSKMRQKSAE